MAVRQSKTLEDREIGKRFAPLWRVLAEQLKKFSSRDEGAFIVPALDALASSQHQGRRNGVGKPVIKLALFWKWTVVCSCCT